MSTKIYNGYKMKKLTTNELFQFVAELKEIVFDFFDKQYTSLFQNEFEQMIDSLMCADHEKDYDKLDKLLLHYYKTYRINAKMLVKNHELDKKDLLENMKKYFLSPCTRVSYVVKNCIESQCSLAEVNHTIMNDDYYFCADLAVLPIFRDYTLFLAYSDSFSRFLDTMIINKDNDPVYAEFIQKYRIEDYHYQNQTDRPDNISNYCWNKRDKDWAKCLHSVPSLDGLCINIMDTDMFFMKKSTSKKNNFVFTSKNKRVKKLAKAKIFDEYYEEYKENHNTESLTDYRIVIEAQHIFKEELKNKNSNLRNRIAKKEMELRNIIVDINEDIFLKDIFFFIPNYRKSI